MFTLTVVVVSFPQVPGGKPLDFNTLLFLGAVVIVLFGCITPREARGSLSWEVFILVAMSFALGTAMEKSGAAQWIADGLLAATKNMGGLLVAAYFVTVVLNAILTNNAAVAVVWPIIDAALRQTGYPVIPFLLALCMAGSADFATPIGYQTNLVSRILIILTSMGSPDVGFRQMVWAPGGYRFIDYTLFGGPLQLIVALVTIPICLWENTWLIWTGVLGLANVIVFIIFLALNWQKLGDTLGITKRFGGETHVHSDIENVRGGSLDEPEDEEVNGADNVSPISKRSSYSNASDTVVPLPIDSSIEVGSAKDVYLK